MSTFTQEDRRLFSRRFNDLPASHRATLYGVPYGRFRFDHGGDFFITRFGWSRLGHLQPEQWYLKEAYSKRGERLTGSTGTVYRVPTMFEGRRKDLVVKFSRFAQEVPLHVESTFPDNIPREVILSAYWNDPFEEFGTLSDLRRGRFGPDDLTIRTKHPLGIYCPPNEFPDWQLGRNKRLIQQHNRMIRDGIEGEDAEDIHLHQRRQYILLYEWVEGFDAEQFYDRGLLSAEEMRLLTLRVERELDSKGFRVLDNKPKHFILRETRDGNLLRDDRGELFYTLIDFELLQRTAEYVRWLKEQKLQT